MFVVIPQDGTAPKRPEAATVVGLAINTEKNEYVAMNIEREVKLCDKTLTDVERGANFKKSFKSVRILGLGAKETGISYLIRS
jgi:hypothetical protein